jgi:hypothetical protein
MESNAPSPPRSAFQFTLRDLLLVFPAVAVTVGVCRWNLTLGVSVGAALLGVLAVYAGIRSHRRSASIAGTLVIVGAVVLIVVQSATVTAWSGSHELYVNVSVRDASTLAPIPNAKVELLHGPWSPFEGPLPDVKRAFEVIPLKNGTALTTDAHGHTSFSHRFCAYGIDGVFRKTGFVRTADAWLRVTCSGYVETYLPIDQQSLGPRNIRDDSAVYVTVPVAKDLLATQVAPSVGKSDR